MTVKPVVAGTDGSAESLRAVDWAAREAVLRGLPLRIVSAMALPPRMNDSEPVPGVDSVSDMLRKARDRALAAAAERVSAVAPDLLVDVDELDGAPSYALTEAGSGAAMLVVGARGIGEFTAMILGSVSQYASAHATCPVVVVREETTAVHRQVVVGIGDPSRSGAALAFAFEEAALRKASLVAVHAWDSPYTQIGQATWALATPGRPALEEETARQLDSLLADWHAKYPDVQVSHDLVHAHPGRALVGLSARADLVVLGRHTTHGARSGAGAVRHAVLNHAHGPVVTVPSV
ncbi:universal stress protein [Trebonia kvetii]|nr:universal stress protein [Trebonia kvetii]